MIISGKKTTKSNVVSSATTTPSKIISGFKSRTTEPSIAFTPGGARITPFELPEFVDLQNNTLNEAMLEQQIADDFSQLGLPDPSVGDFEPVSPDITAAKDAEILSNYNAFVNAEIDRVDTLLTESIGDKWQGSRTKGPIKFTVVDGLVRRQNTGTFADRQAFFKKHYPEGKYSRVSTGGGKFKEVYSLTPDGDVFAVDNVGLGTLPQTTGAITANVANFTTVGSLVGTLFTPFYGTAIGASLGNLVDQAITDDTSLNAAEVLKNLDAGDAATIGLLDGLITKFLPVAGGSLKRFITGEKGGSLLAKTASGQPAVAAQKAAEELGLPLFSGGQLSANQLVRGSFSQTAGTSSIPGRMISNQERKLYELLEQRANRTSLEALNAEELSNYINLQQKELAEQVYDIVSARFGGSLPEGVTMDTFVERIQANAAKLMDSHNEAINDAYVKAFNTSGAQNVVFDLTPLKDIARIIKEGTQIRTVPKRVDKAGRAIDAQGKLIPAPTTRAEGALTGPLGDLVNDIINVIDPTVKKLVKKDKTAKETVDALKQLKALRDRASRLVNENPSDSKSAKQLVDAIDDILNNPVGGGTDFLKFYDEAKVLSKLKGDTMNASNIASMFSRKSEVMPDELAAKFWNGQFTSKDWDYFTKMSKSIAGNKPQAVQTANELISDVQDSFITWLYQNPSKAQERLRSIMESDNDLFKKMVPDAGERKALENISQATTWLDSNGVQATMRRRMTVAERALTAIDNMNEAEIIEFINKSGGLNGKIATDMRAAIFQRLLGNHQKVDQFGVETIDANGLTKELTDLTNFARKSGYDYGRLRPLFQRATLKGDVPSYDRGSTYLKDLNNIKLYSAVLDGFSPDVGGQVQAGAVRAGLARLDIGAYKTVLTNNLLAYIYATPASVAQLQKYQGSFWNRKKANFLANALNQLGDSFLSDTETPKEEVERTGQPPQMGDDLSEPTASVLPSVTPPPLALPTQTAGLNIPPLPLASTPTSTRTSFDNLFPRDDIGSAIANRNRSGIMALT